VLDATATLLKDLTEAHGVSGYEHEVRQVVRRYLEPYGELEQDKIGSVICTHTGRSPAPKVMLAGHMDEIGFMVRHITEEGFLKFLPLGGWSDQVLLGQRVVIKTRERGDVVGVIGAKPPHLLSGEERDKVVKKKDMYIDIGAISQAEVRAAGVQVGDVVVPRADFLVLAGGQTYLSKAFDDRVGCALVVDAMRYCAGHDHPNTVYGVATVMEEVGLRGATTSARAVDPDVAIILESDIAGDVPGIKPEESEIKLGAGPSLIVYDSRLIPNLRLRELVMDTARELELPLQLSAIEAGGTDGGAVHLHGIGVPTVCIAVAARHIHSHGSMIHRRDYDQALQLLTTLIQKLDMSTVAGLTA
jgi:endoglucanase